MREQKYHVYLTAEQSRVIQSLIRLKNELIEQGKYTDAVDDVLCKVVSAKKKRNFFI
jgi:non-homologous end joining protein Ku